MRLPLSLALAAAASALQLGPAPVQPGPKPQLASHTPRPPLAVAAVAAAASCLPSAASAADVMDLLNQPLVTFSDDGYAINPVAYAIAFLIGGYTLIRPSRPSQLDEETAAVVAKSKETEAASAAFVEAAAQAEGSKTTASGLVYEEMVAGEGEPPRIGSEVVVNYEGKLSDGTVFDSSYQRGEPTTFRLGMVIAGWNEGLQMMRPSGKARLTIPAALAYGPRQMGKIPPMSALQFEIELLEIKGREPPSRSGKAVMQAGGGEGEAGAGEGKAAGEAGEAGETGGGVGEGKGPKGLAKFFASAVKATRPPRNPPKRTAEEQAEVDAAPWSVGKLFAEAARSTRYRRLEYSEEVYGSYEAQKTRQEE